MNNDILREILKYVDNSVGYNKIDRLLTNTHNMKRKVDFVSRLLEEKLKVRPSVEDLREKNILKEEKDMNSIKERVNKVLQTKDKNTKSYLAPSISKIVKKMDFEYKKIVIMHKLGIKRVK
ncbi:hypothetical protein NGRA_0211 [Nosema granulosis]|uniref:Uncharacterized protein n=1 Tax=Nosema granulosis TaxID=83296 RepID=A0A9P6H0T1_9MICR|nr:hypothetical protein NGRA_0211 [Nosema granulosis]